MSKESLVFTLGIIVFFTSFLGIPREYKEWIFIASGFLLTVTGYRLRRRAFLASLTHTSGERRGDAFVESTVSPLHETLPEREDERVI